MLVNQLLVFRAVTHFIQVLKQIHQGKSGGEIGVVSFAGQIDIQTQGHGQVIGGHKFDSRDNGDFRGRVLI